MRIIQIGLIAVFLLLIINLYVNIAGIRRDLEEKEIMIGHHDARLVAMEDNQVREHSQVQSLYDYFKLTYDPGNWIEPKAFLTK